MASNQTIEGGMRVCWPERGRAEVVPFRPAAPGAGQGLIETEGTLISPGTERAFFLSLPNATAGFPYYPGYSSVGRVAALGEAPVVSGDGRELRVGDRVVTGSNHASHAVARAERCWVVPGDLSPEE